MDEAQKLHFESFCRYNRFFTEYSKPKPYSGERVVWLIYGDSGSGKSSTIRDHLVTSSSLWSGKVDFKNCRFQDYNCETNVIIENFNLFELGLESHNWLITLLDRYPVSSVGTFGKTQPWCAQNIFLCTAYNKIPEKIDCVKKREFWRRVTRYVEIENENFNEKPNPFFSNVKKTLKINLLN